MVILFCDLCGFTKLSETLDPEEVSNIVHPLFEILSNIIRGYGGSIEKFIGDAIMALFGVPVSHEDDAERALNVALKMQKAIHNYSAEIQHPITMRIGLNVGDVVSGKVSYGGDKPDYTVMGDAVNTAARVEQHTPKGSILVTRPLYDLTQNRFFYRNHPPIQAKGKSEPIDTFELLGIQKLSQAERGSLDIPLVGRDTEIAALQEQGQHLLNKRPVALGVRGEAGVGKSRLFYELQKHLEQVLPLRSFRAFSVSYTQHASLSLLRQILKQVLGLNENDTMETVETQLAGHLRLLPGFGELQRELLLQLLFPERDSEILRYQSADVLQKQWYKVLADFLLKMAQAQPMLLVLEDLQWTDSSSLSWLSYFLTRLQDSDASLLLGATWRDNAEYSTTFDDFPWQEIYTLSPLNEDACCQLLLHHLKLDSVPETLKPLSKRLIERSQGNPYYLEESLKILTEQALVQKAGTWQLTISLKELPLPNSLQRLILSKFDRLPGHLRELLQIAAVAGYQFDLKLLSAVTEQPSENLTASLEECIKEGYLHTDGEQYRFSKLMMRETIYETLLMKRRRTLHLQMGEYLETAKGWPADIFERLAHHFVQAKHTLKAIRYLYIAARQGARFFAHETALSSYEKALSLMGKNELPAEQPISVNAAGNEWLTLAQLKRQTVLAIVDIYWLTGEYKQALEYIESAFSISEDALFLQHLYLNQGKCFEKMSRWEDAMSAYAAAEKHLKHNTRSAEMARLKNATAWTYYRQGEYAKAEAASEAALNILETVPDLKETAYAFNVKGVIHYHQQAWEAALAAYEKSLSIQEQIHDRWGQGNSWSNMGSVYLMTTRMEQAKSAFLKSLELRESLGDSTGVANSCNNLGHIYQEIREPEKAVAFLQRSLNIYQRSGNQLGEAISLCNLGTAHQLSQQFESAEQRLQEGIDRLKALDVKQVLPEAMNGLAEVLLEQEKHVHARRLLEEVEPLLELDPMQNMRFYRLSGWAHALASDFEQSRQQWEKALTLRKPEAQKESKKLYALLQIWAKEVGLRSSEHWHEQLELLNHL